MALTCTIDNGYEFQKLFEDYGRGDSFSSNGYEALYNYLEQLSDDMGEDIYLDVIGLCGDYNEYENYEKLYKDYGYLYNNVEGYDDGFIDWLNDNTIVIEFDGGIIIQAF